jgi:hypothetical protein
MVDLDLRGADHPLLVPRRGRRQVEAPAAKLVLQPIEKPRLAAGIEADDDHGEHAIVAQVRELGEIRLSSSLSGSGASGRGAGAIGSGSRGIE